MVFCPARLEKYSASFLEVMLKAIFVGVQPIGHRDYFKFFKKHAHNDSGHPICVLSRHQAHEDLKAVYSGDSDTDGEGYESDLSL